MIPNIIDHVKASIPYDRYEKFGLHEPFFNELEEQNVVECIRTGWVSYQGRFVTEFEEKLAVACECRYAIAVSSGTVALFMALMAVGVKSGDEVIIPSMTFAATANAVKHLGAIPHMVDSEYTTLGIDIAKLDTYLASNNFIMRDGHLINVHTNAIVRAIVPVYIFGHAFDIAHLISVAAKYSLQIVEDAAEALGSRYKGRAIGAISGVGIVSFNGNKIATTGGGGAILTNDLDIASHIKHLSTTAKLPHSYEFIHDEVGYNFRMPNINAAIGVAQLSKLSSFVAKKRQLATHYAESFNGNEYCSFIKEPENSESNYWLNAILLHPQYASEKNALLETFHANMIYARPLWRPMHMLDIYKDNPRAQDLSVAEDLYNRVICLPSSVFLNE